MKKSEAIQKLAVRLKVPLSAEKLLDFLSTELGLRRDWEPEPSSSDIEFVVNQRVLVLGYDREKWGHIVDIEWVSQSWMYDFKNQWGYRVRFDGGGTHLDGVRSGDLIPASKIRGWEHREYFLTKLPGGSVPCPYCNVC